jgi:hypothetical protein
LKALRFVSGAVARLAGLQEERGGIEMTRIQKLLVAGAAILVLGAGGVGIAQAVGGDADERVTGPEADRAAKAAVDAVGGGRAVGIERDDDDGEAWEVEVVRPDGSEVEVLLTRDLQEVGTETEDDEGESGRETEDDDRETDDDDGGESESEAQDDD